jgi:hypothetical protein
MKYMTPYGTPGGRRCLGFGRRGTRARRNRRSWLAYRDRSGLKPSGRAAIPTSARPKADAAVTPAAAPTGLR